MRPARWFLILSLSLLVTAGGPRIGRTQSPVDGPVDRVEEDWELVIGEPDVATAGPQITTTMRAEPGDDEAPFVVFNLNYRDQPAFAPGGLQVQAWQGNRVLSTATRESEQCSTRDERITWTQSLSVSAGTVSYRVESGESTTWGKFGEGNTLSVSYPSSLAALDAYSPDDSVAKSGVGWLANRVASMTLVRVRYFHDGQLLKTDEDPRAVSLVR